MDWLFTHKKALVDLLGYLIGGAVSHVLWSYLLKPVGQLTWKSFRIKPTPSTKETQVSPFLPIIDLQEDPVAIACKLRLACLEHGFFYVTNHGISNTLCQEVLRETQHFFAQSPREKLRVVVSEQNRGFAPKTEDDPQQRKKDLPAHSKRSKESFFIGREISPESPEYGQPLQGLNKWPSAKDFPQFRDTMSRYFMECWSLSLRITTHIARSLDLPPDQFDLLGAFQNPLLQLRLLHYDPTPSDPARKVFAANPHTDYGYLTVLLIDQTPGLQILDKKTDEWKDIPYVPDAFVINLGDMLQKFTAGLYKSSLHRVVNNSGKDRYSVPFFFEPNVNFVVTPLEKCLNQMMKERKEIHQEDLLAVKSGSHLVERIEQAKLY